MNRSTFLTIVILAFCVAAFGTEAKVSKINAEKSREPEPIPEAISLSAERLYSTNDLAVKPIQDNLVEHFTSDDDAFEMGFLTTSANTATFVFKFGIHLSLIIATLFFIIEVIYWFLTYQWLTMFGVLVLFGLEFLAGVMFMDAGVFMRYRLAKKAKE